MQECNVKSVVAACCLIVEGLDPSACRIVRGVAVTVLQIFKLREIALIPVLVPEPSSYGNRLLSIYPRSS